MLSLKVGEINFGQLPIFYRVNGRDLTIRPGCLLVAKSKNKETRVIPMNQEVHEALKAVVADAPAGDSVFTFSRNGVSTATIKRGFEIACTRAEITYGLTRVGGLTWHGLRHTLQPACGSKSFIRSTSKNSWAIRPFQSRRTMRMARQKLCVERSID